MKKTMLPILLALICATNTHPTMPTTDIQVTTQDSNLALTVGAITAASIVATAFAYRIYRYFYPYIIMSPYALKYATPDNSPTTVADQRIMDEIDPLLQRLNQVQNLYEPVNIFQVTNALGTCGTYLALQAEIVEALSFINNHIDTLKFAFELQNADKQRAAEIQNSLRFASARQATLQNYLTLLTSDAISTKMMLTNISFIDSAPSAPTLENMDASITQPGRFGNIINFDYPIEL